MMYWFEPSGTEEALREAILDMASREASAIQVLAAIGNGWTPGSLDPILLTSPVPIFGGLFPGLIVEGARHDKGFVLIGHSGRSKVTVLDIGEALAASEVALGLGASGCSSFVCYYDATAPMGRLLEVLYDELGPEPSWIGGGAGSLDFVARPVVLTPRGLLGGVAVVAALSESLRVGIAHGWHPIGPPLRVTASEGSDLLSLDWRPAFELYREIVEAHSGLSFGEEPFFELASRYPLFLERLAGEGIVRDPLAPLPGGGLRCAGDVPNHATLRIATGEKANMLEAAHTVRELVSEQGVPVGAVALTIDCISRALFLQERLGEELSELVVAGCPQLGALTIGEIASCHRRFLQLHNKTVVLGLIGS